MRDSIEHKSAGLADDPDEDTIELVLSPQAMGSLARAASETQPESLPVDPVDRPPCASPPYVARCPAPTKVDPRFHRPRMPFETATVLVVTALALASVAYRKANAPAPKAAESFALASTKAQTTTFESEGEPVRFQNPFDPSEVFEFPPGTSEAAARQAVADLLLARGRERLDRPFATRAPRNSRPSVPR